MANFLLPLLFLEYLRESNKSGTKLHYTWDNWIGENWLLWLRTLDLEVYVDFRQLGVPSGFKRILNS